MPRRIPPPRWASAAAIIAAALVFHLLANTAWWRAYDVPPSWDTALHLRQALAYSDALREGRWADLRDVDDYYPPLSRLPAALAHLILSRTENVAAAANFAWFILLVVGTYGLARTWGGRRAGGAAALFVAFTPFLYHHTRFYTTVVPTAAAAVAALWALAAAAGFSRRGPSLVFGLAFGLALLTKWTVAAFVLPPLLYAILSRPREAVPRSARFLNLGLAAVATFFLASPWYLRHLVHFIRAARHTAAEAVAQGDPAVFTIDSATHYLTGTASQLGVVMLAAGVIALLYVVAKRRPGWTFLLTWLFGSLAILTLIRNKDLRFSAPFLPAFGVAFGLAFTDIRRRPLRYALGAVAVAYALSIFAITSSDVVPLPPRVLWKPFRTRLLVYDSERPRREEWRLPAILDDVAAFRRTLNRRAVLCVIPDTAALSEATLQYYVSRDRLDVLVKRPGAAFPNCCDLLLATDGDQGDDQGWAAFDRLRGNPGWFRRAYAPLASYEMEGGIAATLYGRAVDRRPGFELDAGIMVEAHLGAYPWLLREVRNPCVTLEPRRPEKGEYAELRLRAAAATLMGLPVGDLELVLRDVAVNPWAHPEELQFLAIGSMAATFRPREQEFARQLERECPGLAIAELRGRYGALEVKGRYRGLPVSSAVTLADDGRQIRLRCRRLALGPVPFPAAGVRYLNTQIGPLFYRERLPFELGPLAIEDAAEGLTVTFGRI
ncbi:MAG: glycosyltransferase family 39 protein [Candidatus Coatesbacteria bacterium]|nr:MAG: glycosyltransferase family 39 protein [Candidatus Coatesbacteria bacterium]